MRLSNASLRSSELYTPGLSRDLVAEKWSVPVAEVAKLGSAENPYGPSPKALDAVKEAAARIDIYPDWTAAPLREAIGVRYGFDPQWVICGAGETEILSWLIRAYAGPGRRY